MHKIALILAPMMRAKRIGWAAALALGVAVAAPHDAGAFCGFYVGGADAKLFNNATMVVLMREGTRTVLSMQNNYQGPPEDFAMVVPVPVVLQKENVKTLPRDVFDHVDALAAPRLVEYWEQDPCPPEPATATMDGCPAPAPPAAWPPPAAGAAQRPRRPHRGPVHRRRVRGGDPLGARTRSGSTPGCTQNHYKIPEGAEPILRPYVQGGMKFFVAKVDVKKVRFENGMATLSPLRFHYDTDTLQPPGAPRPAQLRRHAGPHRPHPRARQALRGRATTRTSPSPPTTTWARRARDELRRVLRRALRPHARETPRRGRHRVRVGRVELRPVPHARRSSRTSLATLGGDVLDEQAPPPPPPTRRRACVATVTLGDVTSGNKVPNAAQSVEALRGRFVSCFGGALGAARR